MARYRAKATRRSIRIAKANKSQVIDTDEFTFEGVLETVTAIDVMCCVLLVHLDEFNGIIKAWHCAGDDIQIYTNDDVRQRKVDSMPDEVEKAMARLASFRSLDRHRTIAVGPFATRTIGDFFDAVPFQTCYGPIDISYSSLTGRISIFENSQMIYSCAV